MKHILILLLITAGLCVYVNNLQAQEKPMKIGYIDLKRVYEDSGKKAEYDARMKELEQEKIVAITDLRLKISTMEKMKLELGEERRREKEEEIRKLASELKMFEDDARRDVMRKASEFEKEFAEEVRRIVNKIGDEEGYSYILSDLMVLYGDKNHDLTDKVVSIMKAGSDKNIGNPAVEMKKPSDAGK